MPAGESSDGEELVKVRISEDEEHSAPYAWLSHRWGNAHPLQLKKHNISAFKEDIPWHVIPKTFQDAIKVALHLGIHYIWIDSPCIIQDDSQDWSEQASKMAFIYHQALVTITATASNGCDDGLFFHGASTHLGIELERPGKDTLVLRQPINHPPEGVTRHVLDLMLAEGLRHNHPVLGRAWVYQERMLSRRVIHFTEQELFWECHYHSICECNPKGNDEDSRTKHEFHAFVAQHQSLRSVAGDWNNIVTHYSGLGLTHSKDHLNAIAGIASHIARTRGDVLGRYYAGVWEKCRVYNMMWYVEASDSRARPYPPSAPTWSWASVDSTVEYPALMHLTSRCELVSPLASSSHPTSPF